MTSPATKLTVAYEGTAFAGWAMQAGLRTVRGEFERALRTVLRRDEVELTVAGRTDRGVHAWAQVCSYAGGPPRLAGVNALLGSDAKVLEARAMPDGFDARRQCVARRYCYRVLARRVPDPFTRRHALHFRYDLDEDLLHACAAALPGVHDFTAFTPTETEHVRFERIVREARWERVGDELRFWIEADSFLRHMNRALVGTMIQVAAGRRELGSFLALLEGAPRAQAGPTAAAHGLHFVLARYPEDQ